MLYSSYEKKSKSTEKNFLTLILSMTEVKLELLLRSLQLFITRKKVSKMSSWLLVSLLEFGDLSLKKSSKKYDKRVSA